MIKQIKTKNFEIDDLGQFNLFTGKNELLDLFCDEVDEVDFFVRNDRRTMDPANNEYPLETYHYSELDGYFSRMFKRERSWRTQSLDVIKSFVRIAKQKGIESKVRLVRLVEKDGKIKSLLFDYETLEISLERNREVR